MFNKLSIRTRLVCITVLILTICCIGLTVIINYSAGQMASEVAQATTPAQSIDMSENIPEVQPSDLDIAETFEKTESQQQIINTFYGNSMLYMFFIIAAGGIMMYLFSKRILLPLADLNEKIKNSTISNLSDKIIVPNTNDEIAELTASFNKMTDRIQEAFLFEQQFSVNAAHELRTPLTILKTKIEVFNKKEQHSVPEYRQLIFDLKNQVTRLADIVKTLLELTNTDSIQEKEYISVSDMIESIIMEFSNLCKEKNIDFSIDVKDIDIYGNVDLLYEVFYNIIQNSIKYNIDHGSVLISAEKKQEKTVVKICDTGIGIPSESKQRVFEPFFRIDKSRSRLAGGAGLGLSIVKNIIDKHNGTVVISDNKSQGTCFTIELPLQE